MAVKVMFRPRGIQVPCHIREVGHAAKETQIAVLGGEVQKPGGLRKKVRAFLQVNPDRAVPFEGQGVWGQGVRPLPDATVRQQLAVRLSGNRILKSIPSPDKCNQYHRPTGQRLQPMARHEPGQKRNYLFHGGKGRPQGKARSGEPKRAFQPRDGNN